MDTATLEVDAEEAGLRELGIQTDAAQGRAQAEPETPTPQPAPPAPESPEPPQTEPPAPEVPEVAALEKLEKQQQRDDTGKFTKGQKPETDYSRAQKEEERKNRSWQALQAEKENFRRMTSQFQEQQRIQQLEQARASFQPIKKEGLTAQEYYQGYMRFKQTGDYENAARALETALEIQNAEQARVGQVQAVNAEYSWRMGMNEAIQANPEIGNAQSSVAAHVERIIAENPWVYYVPQGFQRVAEIAELLSREDGRQELQEENEQLRAELEKYQRKSQPGKSGYAAPSTGEKDFDEMSTDEMEAHLRRVTAEADNYR